MHMDQGKSIILWIMELPQDTPILGMCLAPIVEPLMTLPGV